MSGACEYPKKRVAFFFALYGHSISHDDFGKVNVDDAMSSVCVCLSVCLSSASHISETNTVIAVKFDFVTVSVRECITYQFGFILTFTQGHTHLNNENNKFYCSIISGTIQEMPIRFAVKIVRLRVYMIVASPIALTFSKVTSASQT